MSKSFTCVQSNLHPQASGACFQSLWNSTDKFQNKQQQQWKSLHTVDWKISSLFQRITVGGTTNPPFFHDGSSLERIWQQDLESKGEWSIDGLKTQKQDPVRMNKLSLSLVFLHDTAQLIPSGMLQPNRKIVTPVCWFALSYSIHNICIPKSASNHEIPPSPCLLRPSSLFPFSSLAVLYVIHFSAWRDWGLSMEIFWQSKHFGA